MIEGSLGSVDPEGRETQAIHELVDFEDKDVLEIGCGDGRLTWRYADATRTVLALDPEETDIQLANAGVPEAWHRKVTFRVADAINVDLPEGAFDVALFSRSI
jgi:ubiquinone/menaquinone biosynthesis C-methylase UbiE